MSTVLDVPSSTLGVTAKRAARLDEPAPPISRDADLFFDSNRLAPARGITRGILISLPAWAVIGVIAYLVL